MTLQQCSRRGELGESPILCLSTIYKKSLTFRVDSIVIRISVMGGFNNDAVKLASDGHKLRWNLIYSI